jgi:hypothetical protein
MPLKCLAFLSAPKLIAICVLAIAPASTAAAPKYNSAQPLLSSGVLSLSDNPRNSGEPPTNSYVSPNYDEIRSKAQKVQVSRAPSPSPITSSSPSKVSATTSQEALIYRFQENNGSPAHDRTVPASLAFVCW